MKKKFHGTLSSVYCFCRNADLQSLEMIALYKKKWYTCPNSLSYNSSLSKQKISKVFLPIFQSPSENCSKDFSSNTTSTFLQLPNPYLKALQNRLQCVRFILRDEFTYYVASLPYITFWNLFTCFGLAIFLSQFVFCC